VTRDWCVADAGQTQKPKRGLACVLFGGELLPRFVPTTGSVQFISGLSGLDSKPIEPPHVDHAVPSYSPAAYADDRQLYRFECDAAIQFPREDPLWSSDPAASIALLLCDRSRDHTATTPFLRQGKLVYHFMGRCMVKHSRIACLPQGGLIQPLGDCCRQRLGVIRSLQEGLHW
jgi:hypothetical protein